MIAMAAGVPGVPKGPWIDASEKNLGGPYVGQGVTHTVDKAVVVSRVFKILLTN